MAESDDDEVEELKISLFQFGKEEPNGDLILVAAQKCIDQGKWRELVDIFTRVENKDALEFVGWQLIALLSQSIVAGNDMDPVQECTTLLSFIAETCSPKEVCIGVLEQLESQTCCKTFVALLDTLRIAIQRLGQKKSKYVGMVLSSITQHIHQIRLAEEPNDMELSGSRRTTDVMHAIMSHVLQFLSPLVQEACSSSLVCSFQKDLIHCLIQLLESPLVFLDTTRDPTEMGSAEDEEEPSIQRSEQHPVASSYRHCAQLIMEYLHICNCSFTYLMEYMSKHSHLYTGSEMSKDHKEEIPEKEIFPAMGLSCFAYLLLVENIEEAHFPSVFSHEYLLTVNMKSIVCLLKRTEHHAVYKGLTLLDLLSRRLKDRSMKLCCDKFADALDVAKALINIMIMCSSTKLRLKGVQIFPEFFGKLDARSRYGLLYTILTDCTHSGVAGLLIYLLKEQINQAFNCSSDDPWFHGSRVMSIFHLLFKPLSAMKAERDVVQETDRIMAALNCLRFILLRDESDKTTVWRNFASVERDFLEPLRETLKVTRIQYQAELISKRDEMAGKKGKEEKECIKFRINSPDGKVLGMMPLPEQCEALQSGLHSLDMMESVLARISEIAHNRSKGRN